MTDGFDQLDAALARLPDVVQVSVLGVAVARAAEVLQNGAQRRARVRTGDLASGMTFELEGTKDGITAHVGPSKEEFYGFFLEFGTAHAPAYPFLRPTIDEDGARAVAVLAATLKDGIDRAARTLAPARTGA